jgi:hypothetical protein
MTWLASVGKATELVEFLDLLGVGSASRSTAVCITTEAPRLAVSVPQPE